MKLLKYAATVALLASACSHDRRAFGDGSEVGGAAGAADDESGGTSGDSNAGAAGESSAGASSGGAGECLAEPICSAGQVDPAEQACGACSTGKQSRSRVCAADACGWEAWSDWSLCSGVTVCAPGATMPCDNGDPCGQRVCSSSCTWGVCEAKTAGGCLSIRDGHTDPGSNYQCCGTGHWQFCHADSCRWSTACDSCTQGAPSYCSECY